MLGEPESPRQMGASDRSDAAAPERRGSGEGAVVSRAQLAARAAAVLKARRFRNGLLGRALFGEPAWDMLLSLYVAASSGSKVSVSGLADWSECPHTTGLRWLQVLEAERLAKRTPHPADKRISLVELTSEGLAALDQFFSQAPGI